MGNDHHGLAALRKITDDRLHFAYHGGVEGAGRLIQQYHIRIHGQRPCDGHALLLPAGELLGILEFPPGEADTP